ncbi:hypothetical protein MRX96_034362 [Rhipicephalus microplus]
MPELRIPTSARHIAGPLGGPELDAEVCAAQYGGPSRTGPVVASSYVNHETRQTQAAMTGSRGGHRGAGPLRCLLRLRVLPTTINEDHISTHPLVKTSFGSSSCGGISPF